MNIQNVKFTIKSLDSLSQLFNDLSSVYDVRMQMLDLVRTDNFGNIVFVNYDLSSQLDILLDSLHRITQAINIYRDKIKSTLSCFELLTND